MNTDQILLNLYHHYGSYKIVSEEVNLSIEEVYNRIQTVYQINRIKSRWEKQGYNELVKGVFN